MSQEGANRWARGHECSRQNASIVPGNSPGGTWNVKWDTVEQIIFHYYTGVHMVDEYGNRLSADYRWNPLRISGIPTSLVSEQSYNLDVQIQNVGVRDLTCSYPYVSYSLRYRWQKAGYSEYVGASEFLLCSLQKGVSSLGSLDLIAPDWGSGEYSLTFDVFAYSVDGGFPSFWFSDYGWSPYIRKICVDGCRTLIPTVRYY
jgi:hypothetical protein